MTLHTGFVEAHLPELHAAARGIRARADDDADAGAGWPRSRRAPDIDDPRPTVACVRAPMTARLVQLEVAVGDVVPQAARSRCSKR